MKIEINKSAKRVLSIALALAMVVGTLFTANVGANIIANAETAPIAEGTVDLLEFGTYLTDMGSTSQWYDTKVADNGETGADWDNAIIIDSAEELVYLCKASGNETAGKYYKVADGLAGFNLANNNLDIDGTLADNMDAIIAAGKNHSGNTPGFQGHFDGNGATVYGAWTNHTAGNVSLYAGLFSATKGEVTIKNIHVNKAHFTATSAVGGIIGYHAADSMCTVTVENCSVTDSYLELTGTGWATAIGGVIGWANSAPSWKESDKGVDGNGDGDMVDTIYVNVAYNVKNCFVDLDEQYFISGAEGDTASSTIRTCHGGVVGGAGSNAVMVSDCIVLGITPYSTSVYTGNDVQHTGGSSHFKNVYTDQATGKVQINYNTGWAYYIQDFSSVVFQLTPAQMQGAAAVGNMNLAWFAVWKPGAEGEYPTFVKPGEESGVSFWTGTADSGFAGGTGTKDDPFIIETADQLYRALSTVTYTTSTSGDLAVETAESVAGGTQTDRIFKQGSTTVYAPVYTPYYYKVADTVDAFYLNNVYGNETLAGAKAMGTSSTKKDWKPGKSFVGHLDGNGVTIYGMYSSTGQGLVYKLDGSSTVKNINFNACYSTASGNSALLTTNLGSYANDSTRIKISNISVRNSYIGTTRAITLTARTDSSGCYDHAPGPAGIVSTNNTPENLTISNCLYDGRSCERSIGASSEATINMMGAIHSGTSSANNLTLSGCVSLGAPAVNEVYVSGKEVFYNRYDKNQGFEVFFYNNYSDMPLNQITTAYPNKYDKLADIVRIEEKDAYEMYDMPKLSWNDWTLVTEESRTFPMPTVNTAEQSIGSYIELVGKGQNNYAGVGPYAYGSNPYTYLLKGAGTEEDPYIIETDVQLARAIATGGMNLYDRLYYKLGCDIDISAGSWITQETRDEGGIYYTYTPFGGTLDGDGHTITGLSAGDEASAGLIPVLDGGTVKNLHIRNAGVVSCDAAGVVVGSVYDTNDGDDIYPTIENCSVEGAKVGAPDYFDGWYFIGYDDIGDTEICKIKNCYFIGESDTVYVTDDYMSYVTADDIKDQIINGDTDEWYIGGKDDSYPRLKAMAEKMDFVDVDGDGIGDEYELKDAISLKNKLLRKSAYKNIYGDVSRDGNINIVDLAVLQRTIADDYGSELSDGFFANLQLGKISIYYGENDNYDAARKVELYLEQITGADVKKVVVDDSVAWGSNSNAAATYVHQNDLCWLDSALYYPIGDSYGEITNSNEKAKYALDGELEIVVGNIANTDYATNNVATADNTYAVTYDAEKQVVWLQGKNFTAVEQAAINFTQGCSVQGDTVYTCGSTVLDDEKKPVTVMLDTNFDGTPDTNKTLYYAWGDEFEEDTINTYNWTHTSQQSENSNGSDGSYNNQEIAPVKDLSKVITITNGRLSMKRGHDSSLGGDVSYNGVVGSVALDVTPGEFNGYQKWLSDNTYVNAIDTDGSDKYFSSGKIITDRGMLYKQGYIEFQGQLPADGHAFPAWWLMGRPSQSATNRGYDNSLYGKVYKLNENYDGVSNDWDEDNLDTYKYQIPSAIYEIDMIEVMQHSDRHYSATGDNDWGINLGGSYHSSYSNVYKNSTTAVNMYFINSTIHKWWNNGVDTQGTSDTSDDRLWIADWDNYKVVGNITNDAFKTTSTAGSWIHNIGSTKYDFGSPTLQSWGKYYYNTGSFNQTAHDNLTKTRRYGFSWNTNGTGFEATLYIYNEDGSLMSTVPIASGMSDYAAFKDGDKKTEANGAIGSNAGIYSDAKVFNQYMYILFDNKYYSANENTVSNGSALQFTDLLTCAGLKSFEIDYVRVYQEDGFRDIVTPETENFNNNNHFGYN